jgi:hypothetical protein
MVILCILRLMRHPKAESGWRLMRAWGIFIEFVQVHLESRITGMGLETAAKAQLLTFVCKILHVKHPSYIFSLFHFASSTHTRNLVVSLHNRTHAMSHSFTVRSDVLWNSLLVKSLPYLCRFISVFWWFCKFRRVAPIRIFGSFTLLRN